MSSYRKERIAGVVRQVVASAISYKLHDPRIAPMTTVTRVEVSRDLLYATIFLSVQGDEAMERRTVQAIRHASGLLRRMVAAELQLRQSIALRVELDEGVKEARRMFELLNENLRENPSLAEPEITTPDAKPKEAQPEARMKTWKENE